MTRSKKSKVTAEELMARLEADPEFVARREAQEANRQQREAELRQAQAPLLADLRDVGIVVESVWDLVNTSTPYTRALPVLVRHLQRTYPDVVLEGIGRALGVKEAKFAWDILLDVYRDSPIERAREGAAVALSIIADRSKLDEIIALVRDPENGPSRLLLLSVLSRSREPRAYETLVDLRDDPDLELEIDVILRRRAKRKH